MTETTEARCAVLVVDDDRMLLETTVAILADHFVVQGTHSPVLGLRILAGRTTDVVVADWQMPGMDGLAFFREVEKMGLCVGCLLITGHMEALAAEVDRDERKTLGLLQKPFSPKVLVARIQHLARLAAMKRGIRTLKADGK